MFADTTSFLIGAALNLFVVGLIVRFIYYPVNRNKNFVFSFIAFSTIIFFVLQFLTSAELSIGFGFGLFAIFSILRYRTAELPIREMTYLFTVIGLAVMNSFITTTGAFIEIGLANAGMVGLLYVLEKEWGFRFETSKRLVYDKVELTTPENHDRLIDDLRTRTGLPIDRVEVEKVDFVKDTADLHIFYDHAKAQAAQRVPQAPVELNGHTDTTALIVSK